ncbi:geranylgeranyl reductase family protein [Methanothermococcus sp.]|uniref:geranylgeranyl reductase family protein n=1 Tax=Methanothermococcus sp. TaxID=2614238 RepID=UPI0025D396AF|nr:geranylgeranyl reductase family protein [Methanothermococcus sp.]
MDFEKYDVVIIGGGPAGCIAGEHIKHHNVLIIEEHQSIGAPLQCAGLISKKGVKELGNPKGIVNKIKGAYIYSKNNTLKIGDDDEIRAYVFERKVMDKDIAIRASKKADFLLKAYGRLIDNNLNKKKNLLNFKTFSKNRDLKYRLSIHHLGETYTICPKVIIGADGARSNIGKSAGLSINREILSGAQLEMVNVNIDDDFVYVFFDRTFCKDFFIWIIPMGKDRVRVGLCNSSNTYKKLLNFINNHPIASKILKNAVPVEFSVGTLPIGYLKTTVKNNLMLVGDAAGQVKPLSGGGLYYGAKCAKICGKIIDEYLANNYGLSYLKNYDKLWKKDIGNEIKAGLRFRTLIKKMDDKKIDKLLEFIIKNNLVEHITKKGDMDNPSIILKDLFKKFLN